MVACSVLLLFWTLVSIKLTLGQDYTSQWAVHIEGGLKLAKQISEKHGFHIIGEIFPDYYHLEHRHISKRSANPGLEYHEKLISEQNVKWAKQQKLLIRSKRDFIAFNRDNGNPKRYSIKGGLNDPKWPKMWYLNRGRDIDMNVQGAWEEGITGKGSVVTILDDGLEKDHPDLVKNYDPLASYDMNSKDEDPMPRYDQMDTNRHGTRCAGEVAATANNSMCSVGVAYGASIGGVRMLDGDVTDAVEARSLSLNSQHIHIYSASWGPDDDGKTVDGPGELATRAFLEGISKGRSGKGSIFVWASGNGGREHDNCNCDGYTNAIWTLSISSATQNGHVPWYSEACSSTLATTYSSGSNFESQIITTDLHHDCTNNHTGTSASAPLAAGIVALALEANNELTWRDMQHIVVLTARPTHLLASDWVVNGVGRKVSHSFGYGLMDATAMVRLARRWKTVPAQHVCNITAQVFDKPVPARSSVTIHLLVKECNRVNFLEHVQAKISLSANRRGDIKIDLTSPSGTRSTLLAPRTHDNSHAGFHVWPFMTVHMWGERPFGVWQLTIHNEGKLLATLTDWEMVFYGTILPPTDVSQTLLTSIRVNNNITVDEYSENSIKSGNCRVTTTSCLECLREYKIYHGKCYDKCPPRTYQENYYGLCADCHYSCYKCNGPNDYQCTVCWEDAELIHTLGQTFCYPKSIKRLLDDRTWHTYSTILLIINIILLLVFFKCKFCMSNNNLTDIANYRLANQIDGDD
ncbi:furin-like protease 1 isoform X2 [Daktulosphaira vitifoliae]|uniref:furin-like protease 1 isoform X2 n=1 Tax=Daktulosphaira vitifoliae TaxID=58002 RepID=UPI0021A98456|nr:furin-like protease 1 isoform X2 [Daktulosphaira vitifoliae]